MIREKNVTLEEEEWRQILLSQDLKQVKEIVSKAVSRKNRIKKKRFQDKQKNFKKTGTAGYYQKKKAEEFRADLVKRQTNAEKRMKAVLKSLDIKYEFQHIFYTAESFYIVDFYLKDFNAVIEVDGGYHNTEDQKKLDKRRDTILSKLGFKTYRISNYITEDAVLARKEIQKVLKKLN